MMEGKTIQQLYRNYTAAIIHQTQQMNDKIVVAGMKRNEL